MKRLRHLALFALLWLAASAAQAFGLAELQQQLARYPLLRGQFVQEKQIAGLPQPLRARGHFSLIKDKGLLWTLREPLSLRLRISAQGVAQHTPSGWQGAPQNASSAQQNALLLALLRGDSAALQGYFALALSGQESDWQLTLTPKTALLQKIFTRIQLSGGLLLSRLELRESSGEITRIALHEVKAGTQPNAEEEQAFAD